ncbi:MAG: aminotransferase class I/II-fold pyridoxal phosphate-dependent enzyme [Acidobacteriota bacterium]
MISRRRFTGKLAWLGAAASMGAERALAQRSLLERKAPPGMVWLNANENPDGPCPAAIKAMSEALPLAWRYHYQEMPDVYAAIARNEQLEPAQVLVGAGSAEILHIAVDAFTSPTRPLITPVPTFEAPIDITAALGRKVIRVPLTKDYAADVRRLAEEATRAGGGVIYLCNPNNPTANLTPKAEVAWLAQNLPRDTVLLVDEAYLHFVEGYEEISALPYVRQGKEVVVTRTFSKIYGMAGLRVGFGCARPDLIQRMRPFRAGVISYVSARAVLAALEEGPRPIAERRARLARVRGGLCEWLRQKKLGYIEPQANFMMIDVGRDVRELGQALWEKGIAVGRPFPPLDHMLRVTIGAEQDMAKFRAAFEQVYFG